MWHIQGRKNYYSRLRHQQIIRNEKMMQTSKAFKDLAIKIQNMSGIEEDDQGLMDAAVEFDINENMCKGCANGRFNIWKGRSLTTFGTIKCWKQGRQWQFNLMKCQTLLNTIPSLFHRKKEIYLVWKII